MILKSPVSRLSLVNLFADFILNQIPKEEESIIQVVDCFNFYVIKGKTTYNEPLNIGKLKDEFIIKFEELIGDIKLTHSIDLIEYDSKLKPSDSLTFSYHNSENCSYNNPQIKSYKDDNTVSYDYQYFLKPILENKNLIFCSEFPHGYSLNQGRLLYYYGKHIFYNIPSSYPVSTLVFEMSTKKDESGEQIFLVKNKLNEVDNVLTSAILDVFDFNMSSLEQDIKKVDWFIEITNPLEDYDFLKKRIKDFIIF
jgi:hypothetical protein